MCHAGFSIGIHFKNSEKGVAVDVSQEWTVFCGMFVEVDCEGFYGWGAINNLRGIGNYAVRFVSDDVGDFTFSEDG